MRDRLFQIIAQAENEVRIVLSVLYNRYVVYVGQLSYLYYIIVMLSMCKDPAKPSRVVIENWREQLKNKL